LMSVYARALAACGLLAANERADPSRRP